MNHILARNRNTGTPAAPQGVDRYYPYADNLTPAQGETLLAQDLANGTALAKLLSAMPGVNQLRQTATVPTPTASDVLGFVGRNGNGNGGGSLSVYVYGVLADALYLKITSTGATTAYLFEKAMGYDAAGYPRDGLIPSAAKPLFASLTGEMPNGTYLVEVLTAAAKRVLYKNIEVTTAGPELAIRTNDTGATSPSPTPTPTPTPTTGSSDPVAYDRTSGSSASPEPGTDMNGNSFTTQSAPTY